MERYLKHQEIIEKTKRISGSYALDQGFFDDIIDQLLNSELESEDVILEGLQRLLQEVDHEIGRMEHFADLTASCFKGCDFCCYFPIVLSKMEAKMMFQSIKNFSEDRKQAIYDHWDRYYEKYAKTLKQALAMDHSADDTKLAYKKLNLPCPMLDPETQACMAYEVRPIPCRTYLNYSDPKVCAEQHLPQEPTSYEFLYNHYFEAINELVQVLYENGEDVVVDYPSDVWSYDYLPAWIEKWREGIWDEL
ncbi:YkgJ family cysteine cluster protein [Halobacillus naozhouensis]|uniref:YkgJ family cysteine cluster protein n=1 Tax=Halobacillus naozhouensis TaxID=554880 RepID=A0ABY8J171_9BACI|nr:YkgJ family cysteine cluster protein [Halobacillus naozhouensis]WFT75802.1 YkgJ family cysteine cluster protein [Halobacillus naozhouensis]